MPSRPKNDVALGGSPSRGTGDIQKKKDEECDPCDKNSHLGPPNVPSIYAIIWHTLLSPHCLSRQVCFFYLLTYMTPKVLLLFQLTDSNLGFAPCAAMDTLDRGFISHCSPQRKKWLDQILAPHPCLKPAVPREMVITKTKRIPYGLLMHGDWLTTDHFFPSCALNTKCGSWKKKKSRKTTAEKNALQVCGLNCTKGCVREGYGIPRNSGVFESNTKYFAVNSIPCLLVE